MFRYDDLREQWLIVYFFVGIALIFYLVLFYIDTSLPRKKKPASEEFELHYLSWHKAIPWSIWVTAISVLLFMFIYLLIHLIYPISI
jgi:heme/copper-type cytochrome/quinol oxidase subunit 2